MINAVAVGAVLLLQAGCAPVLHQGPWYSISRDTVCREERPFFGGEVTIVCIQIRGEQS